MEKLMKKNYVSPRIYEVTMKTEMSFMSSDNETLVVDSYDGMVYTQD